MLSLKFRMEASRTQSDAVVAMFGAFCDLYNAALQQRIEAYRRRGITLRYNDQALELKAVREADERLAEYSFSAEQQVLRRLNIAFTAFFKRCKEGKKPGFPRFKVKARFHSAMLRVGDGLVIKDGGVRIVGVPGAIKVRWHRHLPSKPASAIVTRQAGKWYIVFQCEIEAAQRTNFDTVGIDVGLTALVAQSNGHTQPRPNFTKRGEKRLRRLSRALARSNKGSKRRRKRTAPLAKHHKHIANWRRDHAHKVSRRIVNRFGRIGVEDLNVKGLAAGMHAKHVNDAAWAQLVSMIGYKAVNAGGEIVYVDPRGTSQECPECGQVRPKTLKDRWHSCDCGAEMHRDVASAKVVHFRAFGFKARNGLPVLCEAVAAQRPLPGWR